MKRTGGTETSTLDVNTYFVVTIIILEHTLFQQHYTKCLFYLHGVRSSKLHSLEDTEEIKRNM